MGDDGPRLVPQATRVSKTKIGMVAAAIFYRTYINHPSSYLILHLILPFIFDSFIPTTQTVSDMSLSTFRNSSIYSPVSKVSDSTRDFRDFAF